MRQERPDSTRHRLRARIVIFAILGSVLLLAGAIGGRQVLRQVWADAGRRSAQREVRASARDAGAPEGILGAQWLMTMADVRRVRPAVQPGLKANELVESLEMFGRQVAVAYQQEEERQERQDRQREIQRAKVREYAETSERWYDARLEHLTSCLDNAREWARENEEVYEGQHAKDLAYWEQAIEEHENGGPRPMYFGRSRVVSPAPDIQYEAWTFEVGRIGYIEGVRIIQIVDDSTLLLSVRDHPNESPRTVMVKGVGTSGHVDGDVVTIRTMLEVVGPTRYTSVLGATRTVSLLEPFDIDPYRSMMPASCLKD